MPRSDASVLKRMSSAAVLATVLTASSSAQNYIADSGAPAVAFPELDRPVAEIVSAIWHDEKERYDAGEPHQLVRPLVQSGMTVADIGAGSGYYVVRYLRSSDHEAASSQKMSCPNICGACASGCAISDC
jgi:hypothetical protein